MIVVQDAPEMLAADRLEGARIDWLSVVPADLKGNGADHARQ